MVPIFNDLSLIRGMRLSKRSSSAAPRSLTSFTELDTLLKVAYLVKMARQKWPI